MKNLSFQARCVTKPIKNSLIGYWLEFYIFYCKHRDLEDSQLFQNMVLDPGVSLTTSPYWRVAATDALSNGITSSGFHSGTGMDWAAACLEVVVREYFRDEQDTTHNAAGFKLASVSQNMWLDSLTLESKQATADFNVDLDADTFVEASEVERAMRTYEMMVTGGLINMSYEDWLRSYGVRQSQAVRNVPELIRYVREWTYPSSHVNPADGKASSACSWSIAERADKDRFFAEPGFIFGVTVCRPKVYYSGVKQPGTSLMNDCYSWLPALLRDDAGASIKRVTDDVNDALGGGATSNWMVDIKDLLLYGDQLVNIPLSSLDANLVALPRPSAEVRYPSITDITALFVTPADVNMGVGMDGIVRLSILGTQSDTTPRGSSLGGIM